jgi:hypothetical protein
MPAQGRRVLGALSAAALVATAGGAWQGARADNFSNVYYEASTDSLVVTMSYLGSNPNHNFTLKWGRCKMSNDGTHQVIVAEVLDDQYLDGEGQQYSKTTRFSLASVQCRPARVTLRSAPRFYTKVNIPAAP